MLLPYKTKTMNLKVVLYKSDSDGEVVARIGRCYGGGWLEFEAIIRALYYFANELLDELKWNEEKARELLEEALAEDKAIFCGTCGLRCNSEEEFEMHTFHYKGERLCGIRLLRIIEKDPELSRLVYEKWKSEVRRVEDED